MLNREMSKGGKILGERRGYREDNIPGVLNSIPAHFPASSSTAPRYRTIPDTILNIYMYNYIKIFVLNFEYLDHIVNHL